MKKYFQFDLLTSHFTSVYFPQTLENGEIFIPINTTDVDPGPDPLSKKWNGLEWVPIPLKETEHYQNQKRKRDGLLAKSDWTQLPDTDPQHKEEWLVYRQQLRDIPQQPEFPFKIQWPLSPDLLPTLHPQG